MTDLHAVLRATVAPAIVVGLLSAAPVLATSVGDPEFTPIGRSIPSIIGRVIAGILGVVGILALGMFVYGGTMWMTAAGNQERITKAKNTVVWAIIGLMVVLGAGTLVRFVLGALGV